MTKEQQAARDARRKANARAYLREKPPRGQGWTQKKQGYVYDKEETQCSIYSTSTAR